MRIHVSLSVLQEVQSLKEHVVRKRYFEACFALRVHISKQSCRNRCKSMLSVYKDFGYRMNLSKAVQMFFFSHSRSSKVDPISVVNPVYKFKLEEEIKQILHHS